MHDAVIIGAGAAGLAAAQDLLRAGAKICCLEARDRIGGRILTVHGEAPAPVELGAEFVHGRPPEIFELAERAGIGIYETAGRMVGLGEEEADSGSVMEELSRTATEERDETFQSFLERTSFSRAQKEQAAAFVEGFNAARRELIGVASIAQDKQASDRIDGESSFRVREGYDALIRALASGVEVRLGRAVEAIEWKPGAVKIFTRAEPIEARSVLVTVPLGVLQSGAIRFDPEPTDAMAAARALRFGDAIRVTFLFDHAFWDQQPETAGIGFLFSEEPLFPVWWTGRPAEPLLITGWSAGPKADPLIGQPRDAIVAQALATLSRIMKTQPPNPRGVWFHDWNADPFSRGAYSYVPAGALPARRKLAEPVADTLYFAGEATDLLGYTGAVHGAIASGRRAAAQILRR
ncbi:MAG TPA: NAD(P)/FAD-dependent oxidoreductase [Candidatus Acidoferrales bacterium]|nr:NAD(P)/FAD-dependent oxidoreductase [Candidatus Acidoferrales bacterium]